MHDTFIDENIFFKNPILEVKKLNQKYSGCDIKKEENEKKKV